MPKIPKYTPGQVENSPLPASRFSANATGASFGGAQAAALGDAAQGLARVGNTLHQIGTDIQEEENKTLVREALNASKTEARDFLTKDIFQRQGLNAMNVEGEVKQRMASIRDASMSKLKNGAQKEMFKNLWLEIEDDHMGRVQNFQLSELKRAREITKSAENYNAIQDAIAYRNDPQKIEEGAFTIRQNTRNTWSPYGTEAVKAKTAEALNDYYSNILESIEGTSSKEALIFLDQHKEHFEPRAYRIFQDRLQKQVRDEVINGASLEITSKPGATIEDAAKFADETFKDPQERQQFMSLSKARFEEKKTAETLKYQQAYEAEWAKKEQDPTLPPPKWFKHEDKIKWAKHTEATAKKARGEQQESHYGKLISNIHNLGNVSLPEHAPYLSQDQYSFLKKLQDDLKKGGTKETDAFKKAFDDAKQEAKTLSFFQIKESDSDTVAQRKHDALNQYLSVYADRLRAVPDEKRTDWKTARDIRRELLKEIVLDNTGNDWIPFNERTAKQFEIESGAVEGSVDVDDGSASYPTNVGVNFVTPQQVKFADTSRNITEEEYNKLPSGALFMWNGQLRRKK